MSARNVIVTSALVALSLLCFGCADGNQGGDDFDTASLALLEGSPQSIGLLTFLNDPATTFDVLDLEVGLDRRAAEHLIAWRDGADGLAGTADDDLFDSLDEVDAVYWVGANALLLIKQFATDAGWVPTGDDYLGTWDDVSFTALEAALVLELANRGAYLELDDEVQLDRRAVDHIFAERPIDSAMHLASVKWVGKATLTRMKTYAVERYEAAQP